MRSDKFNDKLSFLSNIFNKIKASKMCIYSRNTLLDRCRRQWNDNF